MADFFVFSGLGPENGNVFRFSENLRSFLFFGLGAKKLLSSKYKTLFQCVFFFLLFELGKLLPEI